MPTASSIGRSSFWLRTSMSVASDYQERINAALAYLGIPLELVRKRGLPLCFEAEELIVAETDSLGREHRLTPAAAHAWREMKAAAHADGVGLQIVSAFRSFDRQVDIVRRK